MIRSSRRMGALGVCTVAVLALGPVAPASADTVDGFEFTLYAKEVPGPSPSASAPAPEVGDTMAFADDLYKTKDAGGDKVGRDGAVCVVVRTGDPMDLQCVGTVVLNGGPGGTLALQTLAAVDPTDQAPPALDIAITGGTGDFKNARGWVRSTPDGDWSKMEFHIATR
ncbi:MULTISPECIES: dirigent protein [unclassified Streptomyces]|uniref:dirigent protein n=1 Tax=unclassified Streptomyces TaxID=2593676 RepID=UPI002E347897|nr:dirigent protein [Streptomyces sp. NBC_01268]